MSHSMNTLSQSNEVGGFAPVKDGQLYYRQFGAGEPLVILHGGPGGDHLTFLPRMLELAKDYEVVLYDQRGCGKSLECGVTPETITVPQFVQDLDDLRRHLGYKTMTVMGHSWGGRLGMEYALVHPDHLSKLILVDPTPSTFAGQAAFTEFLMQHQGLFVNLVELYNTREDGDAEVIAAYRNIMEKYLHDPKSMKDQPIEFHKKAALSGMQVGGLMGQTAWMQPGFDLRPQLKNMTVPTLVIHGRYDPVPLWTAQETYAALPHGRMVELDDCGHSPFMEKPPEFFKAVRDFLGAE